MILSSVLKKTKQANAMERTWVVIVDDLVRESLLVTYLMAYLKEIFIDL